LEFAIEVHNLSKRFVKEKSIGELIRHPLRKEVICALDCVNLKVRKGEIFGLLGQNGAGKTTLLKVLSTLILPDSGIAYVNGYNVVKEEDLVKTKIGLIHSEERSFFWRLTAEQNLEFFASLYGISGSYAKERIENLLKLVELDKFNNSRFDSFSSGMKHRLSIARGLLNDPEVLLVDELTTGIDPIGASKIRDFLKQLSVEMGKTILLTTHNLHEAEAICDRIAILHKGKVRAVGTVAQLKRKTKQENLEQMFKKVVADV